MGNYSFASPEMRVLVDTSIWIDYFRDAKNSAELDDLIREDLIVINDIILAEMIPFLKVRAQLPVVRLLREVDRLPMQINWEEIIEFQVKCLQSGANGVGIPDLLIAQNAKSYNCEIYSLDKHFQLLSQVAKVKLFLCDP